MKPQQEVIACPGFTGYRLNESEGWKIPWRPLGRVFTTVRASEHRTVVVF